MDESQRKIIDKHVVRFVNDMEARDIAINLQSKHLFSDHDVDTITAEGTDLDRRRRLLVIIKTKGNKAFNLLVEALQETNQKHLADLLMSDNPTAKSSSTTSTKFYQKVQESLIIMYLERFRKIKPFSLPFTFDIEKAWVSLALRGDHSHPTEDYAELLKSAFEKEKMLIIEGKPASGKTSLMQRLAYDWAIKKNNWLRLVHERITGKGLSHYDLVVCAQFRDVRELEFQSIADLVIEYNKKYMEKDELESLHSLLHNKKCCQQKRVLVLLDGYDESSLDKQCKELTEYLTATTIREELSFNIVITTRPGYLGQHRGNNGRYIFADVLGFTTVKQKEKYISNHFKPLNTENKKNIVAVHHLLQRNINMNKLAEIPLFLTFICLVHQRIHDGTVLELYCNIIWWLIDRYQKDFPDRDIPLLFEYQSVSGKDKFEIIQDHYHQFPQLHCLGKMGLHNLNKDIFHESDFRQFNLKEVLQKVGLLRKDKFHDQRFRLATSYSFPHRTIQEFFAALYFFCSMEQLDLSVHHRVAPNSKLNTSEMTQYQNFLLQLALSGELPIVPAKSNIYFERITDIEIHLLSHAFNTVNGVNNKLISSLFSQCKNVRRISVTGSLESIEQDCNYTHSKQGDFKIFSYNSNSISLSLNNLLHLASTTFLECSFDLSFELFVENCPALKNVIFNKCEFEKSVFHFKNLSSIDTWELVDCTLHNNIELPTENSPALKNMKFDRCVFNKSVLNFMNISSIDIWELVNCTFHSNIELPVINCSALKNMKFYKCEFKMKYIVFTKLPATDSWELVDCKFHNNSELSVINCAALKYMKFYKCTLDIRRIVIDKLLAIARLEFGNCNFHTVFKLSVINCSGLRNMKFYYCTLEIGHILFTELPAIVNMEFDNCHFNASTNLTIKNCSTLENIKFKKCTLEIKHIVFTELRAITSLDFDYCTFDIGSQLSFNNCPALKNMKLSDSDIKRGCTMNIGKSTTIDTLEFYYCNIHLKAWQSITEVITNSFVKCLKLSFKGESVTNEYVNQLQKCDNDKINIEIKIDRYIMRSKDHFSFHSLINLHLLTFSECSFGSDSQLSLIKCPALKHLTLSNCKIDRNHVISIGKSTAIETLEFYYCSINMEAWQSITKEIRNSSVRCLKFTPDCSKYLEFMQICDKIESIFVVNHITVKYELSENDVVPELIKLARNMRNLKKIIFDFTKEKGELKESNKEIIEKTGQKRNTTFKVLIIPYKPRYKR